MKTARKPNGSPHTFTRYQALTSQKTKLTRILHPHNISPQENYASTLTTHDPKTGRISAGSEKRGQVNFCERLVAKDLRPVIRVVI